MDFSHYPSSGRFYGGSEKKTGILIGSSPYMLKFQKKSGFGIRSNHVSEYLGSHIFELLGIPAQETFLGTYMNEEVVACRDFVGTQVEFVPFNDVGQSTLDQDKEAYQYSYEDIMQMLRDNAKLTRVEETVQAFWDIYIVDALLGNFDRHGANWGFIKNNNAYSLAPVFDNGSCLFPSMADDAEMEAIMLSKQETDKRVFTFPTSQIRLLDKKSSYHDVIASRAFPECNSALERICDRLDMRSIRDLIDETPLISETRKRFLEHMITARYEKILKSPRDALLKDAP